MLIMCRHLCSLGPGGYIRRPKELCFEALDLDLLSLDFRVGNRKPTGKSHLGENSSLSQDSVVFSCLMKDFYSPCPFVQLSVINKWMGHICSHNAGPKSVPGDRPLPGLAACFC